MSDKEDPHCPKTQAKRVRDLESLARGINLLRLRRAVASIRASIADPFYNRSKK